MTDHMWCWDVSNWTQVAELSPAGGALSALKGALDSMTDLERAISRAFHGRGSPAEFLVIMCTLSSLPAKLNYDPSCDAGTALCFFS